VYSDPFIIEQLRSNTQQVLGMNHEYLSHTLSITLLCALIHMRSEKSVESLSKGCSLSLPPTENSKEIKMQYTPITTGTPRCATFYPNVTSE
jgi:hypothetical protein